MPNPFGRYSLTNLLFHHGAPISPSNDGGFGRYSLPNVLGRLFHHGQTPPQTGGYDLSPGGSLGGGTIPLSPYTGGLFNIGPPNTGGPDQSNTLDGTIPMSQPNFHMTNIGPPQIGGGGPSQTTNGFTTAFRGGGDVYGGSQFTKDLRIKGGTALY